MPVIPLLHSPPPLDLMHIPVRTVGALSVIAALTTWFIGTRDMDFAQPPTPKEYIEITEEWNKSKPRIAPTDTAAVSPLHSSIENKPSLPGFPRSGASFLPLDLNRKPSLSEFGTLEGKGAGHLVLLARHLQSSGQSEFALLAWERILDMAHPSAQQREMALSSIRELKGTIAPWNPNPRDGITLQLRAGASIKKGIHLEKALQAVAKEMSKASGNIINMEAQISLAKSSASQNSVAPVAIWISKESAEESSPSAETALVSFTADTANAAALTSEIQAGVYDLVRAHLAIETSFSELPVRLEDSEPGDLIAHYITRLMWREFANSLAPQ
ncbi:MAG: hypothetical protein ACPH5P_07240 [Akkermansiaceae bacterium]